MKQKLRRVVLGVGHLQILRGASNSLTLWETMSGPEAKMRGQKWEGAYVRLFAEIIE